MKYAIIVCLMTLLVACDEPEPSSPLFQTCENIAISRLKHPKSFDYEAGSIITSAEQPTNVEITFKAWNDYKVPMPHHIRCKFDTSTTGNTPVLLSIKWNGRPIRQHELDQIREKVRLRTH